VKKRLLKLQVSRRKRRLLQTRFDGVSLIPCTNILAFGLFE